MTALCQIFFWQFLPVLDSEKEETRNAGERATGKGCRLDSNPGCYPSPMWPVITCPPTELNWNQLCQILYL